MLEALELLLVAGVCGLAMWAAYLLATFWHARPPRTWRHRRR